MLLCILFYLKKIYFNFWTFQTEKVRSRSSFWREFLILYKIKFSFIHLKIILISQKSLIITPLMLLFLKKNPLQYIIIIDIFNCYFPVYTMLLNSLYSYKLLRQNIHCINVILIINKYRKGILQ